MAETACIIICSIIITDNNATSSLIDRKNWIEGGTYMVENEISICDECGSAFLKAGSKMMGLCPECAHILYGYPNCKHVFQNGKCVYCYWDGSKSDYIR